MFAPEGYVPLSAAIEDARYDLLETVSGYMLRESFRPISPLSWSYDDIVLLCVRKYLFGQIHIGNLNGQILRIDDGEFFHLDMPMNFVDEADYQTLKDGSGKGSLAAKNYRQLCRDFNAGMACSEANRNEAKKLCSDRRDLSASTEHNEVEIQELDAKLVALKKESDLVWGYINPPLLYNFRLGVIDFAFHAAFSKIWEHRDAKMRVNSYKQFEGWYLFFPDNLWGKNWDVFKKEIQTYLDAIDIDWVRGSGYSEPFEVLGRLRMPRKRILVKSTFEEIYPLGRGPDSWVLAARKIENLIGESVSVDTLLRALGRK